MSPRYGESSAGGTSLAAPLVAGMVAAAQQGQARPSGFINPVLYKLAGTRALHDALPLNRLSPAPYRASMAYCPPSICGKSFSGFLYEFDTQAPYSAQVTRRGYDNMSGIGTPNGQLFIRALRQQDG